MNWPRVLLAGAAVLACVVVAELAWPEHQPPPLPAATAAAAPVPPAVAADQVLGWVAALLARPPFAPERRPPASAPDAVSEVAGPPRLAGIMVTGDGSSALFASEEGRAVVAHVGGHVGAYEVRAIRTGEVVVAGPDGQHTLHPSFAEGSNAPPPPAASPPAFVRPILPRLGVAPGTPGLLPPPPPADTRPFEQMATPSGAAIFRNARPPAGVRQ